MLARSQFLTCHSPNQRSQPRDGKDKKGRKALFCWLSIRMNRWNTFYQNIRDPSWPECANEHEFTKLPAHIQEEIITVFNGNDYLYLTKEDLHYLPLTISNQTNIDNRFELEFKVANDFVVYYNCNIEGGGIQGGQNFPRIIRCLYPDRTFEHCLEWAAGHGAIGFRILADGICKKLHLVESDQSAVDACNKTIDNVPKRYVGSTTVTLTDTLATLDQSLVFDLIVANPPAYQSQIWTTNNFPNMEMTQWQRITHDKDWQVHQNFFKHIKKHLADDGIILLQEQMFGSSVFEFEQFINAGGLKIISAFYEKHNAITWYLELTHK